MFEVIDVSGWEADVLEAVGTRPKGWLFAPDRSSWLFKESRSGVGVGGEDWAEKAAAELGNLLGIPTATVELATRSGSKGIVTRSFVKRGAHLAHGNELLSAIYPAYPQAQRTNNTAGYTVEAIRNALEPYSGPEGGEIPALASAFDWFCGYLFFDAWINNTDRHHMNWGVLDPTKALAPSFDHGSSRAFGEPDTRKAEILDGGAARLMRWLERGRTRSFQTMPTIVAVAVEAADLTSTAARTYWIERLANVDHVEVCAVIDELPGVGPAGPILSDVSRTLCKDILRINRQRLLDAVTTTTE